MQWLQAEFLGGSVSLAVDDGPLSHPYAHQRVESSGNRRIGYSSEVGDAIGETKSICCGRLKVAVTGLELSTFQPIGRRNLDYEPALE